MSIDFPLILLLAVAFTGGAWLFDALVLAPARRKRGEEAGAEPVVVEYSVPTISTFTPGTAPIPSAILAPPSFCP